MRIAVLGAGVVGVTSAWRLALAGHEVVLVDQAESAATGASSANAGMIAPGHSKPWSAPGAPWLLARSVVGRRARLRIKRYPDRELRRWGLRFLSECRPRRARRNAEIALRLSAYSQSLLERWAQEEGIDYDARRGGAVYLQHSRRELDAASRRSRLFARERPQRILDLPQLAACEPALARAGEAGVVGAIFDPADSSGSAAAFTGALVRRCRTLGVEVRLGERVEALSCAAGRVNSALLDRGSVEADLFIVCLGGWSSSLARTAGETLTVYPVKGYAATFPLLEPGAAPTLPGCDDTELVAWSRQRDRLRMSTGAVFGADQSAPSENEIEPILRMGRRLFAGAADFDAPEIAVGFRPMTPDGIPVVGYGRRNSNLVFNTGQGHVGWTMACGSAQLLVDLIAQRPSVLDPKPLQLR